MISITSHSPFRKNNMATARLKYVPMDTSSGAKPFIVHFTNADLRDTGKRKIKFGCFRWADPTDQRKRQRRTLVAESDTMEYVGQNFGQASRSNLLCKYIVGIYNEKTEVMEMYDTEMVTLQPQILTNGHELEEEQESKMDLSLIEKKDLLTQAFGSNKKKRAVASRLRNKIDSEEVGGTVSGLIENLATESVSSNDSIDQQYLTIPPFNPNAETVADVYKFEDIITPLEYDALKRSATELQNSNKERIKEWRSQKVFPEYVLQHLEILSVNPSQRLHQSCCLLYLSFLINMYNLNNKDFRKQDPLHGVPNIIKDRLLSMFSLVKGKARAIPKRLKDKLVSYILVLALLIDEFSLEFTFIMKDLRMAAPRFHNYVKAVGCVIQSTKIQGKRKFGEGETPSKRAILQVPLPPDFTQAPIR